MTAVAVDDVAIRRAADILRAGGLVAFPTETVYGLGAHARDAAAVGRIFAVKGRPASNPLIVHVADAGLATTVAAALPEPAERLARRFWPGPLTLVLPRRPDLPDAVTAGGPTVAVRVPAHPVAVRLLREAGLPVAAPSANRSTELSPTTAGHVLKSLGDRVDLILDGGPCPGGIESTVVDVTTSPPRLLRPGLVGRAELEAVVGAIALGPGAEAIARAPGQMDRHYAPRTPLTLGGADVARHLAAHGRRIAWLTRPGGADVPTATRHELPADEAGYAAGLYAALHDLDSAGFDAIVVDPPPPDWHAIRDRLRRAAT